MKKILFLFFALLAIVIPNLSRAAGIIGQQSIGTNLTNKEESSWYEVLNYTPITATTSITQVILKLQPNASTTSLSASIKSYTCADVSSNPGTLMTGVTNLGNLTNSDTVIAGSLSSYRFTALTPITIPAGACVIVQFNTNGTGSQMKIGGNTVRTNSFFGQTEAEGFLYNVNGPPWEASSTDAYYTICDESCTTWSDVYSPPSETETALCTKFPFAYFCDLKQIYSTTISTSTGQLPVLSISLPSMTGSGASTSLTIISSSTVQNTIGSTTFNALYTLIEWGAWLTLAYYFYDRIRHLKLFNV